MIAKNIRVNGTVQGVFFRATTKEKADELGIKGWVRNCRKRSDSVKIYAEGEEGAVEKFIEWCRKGPERADVKEVEIAEAKAENSTSFEVTD
jgi:acylphosphatase